MPKKDSWESFVEDFKDKADVRRKQTGTVVKKTASFRPGFLKSAGLLTTAIDHPIATMAALGGLTGGGLSAAHGNDWKNTAQAGLAGAGIGGMLGWMFDPNQIPEILGRIKNWAAAPSSAAVGASRATPLADEFFSSGGLVLPSGKPVIIENSVPTGQLKNVLEELLREGLS